MGMLLIFLFFAGVSIPMFYQEGRGLTGLAEAIYHFTIGSVEFVETAIPKTKPDNWEELEIKVFDSQSVEIPLRRSAVQTKEEVNPLELGIYFVRYGTFLKKKKATLYRWVLQKKGIPAFVQKGMKVLTAYKVKSGPYWAYWYRDSAFGELKKLGLSNIRIDEQKYLVVGSVWSKRKAKRLLKKVRSALPDAKLYSTRKKKTVYQVVSSNLASREEAELVLKKSGGGLKIRPTIVKVKIGNNNDKNTLAVN